MPCSGAARQCARPVLLAPGDWGGKPGEETGAKAAVANDRGGTRHEEQDWNSCRPSAERNVSSEGGRQEARTLCAIARAAAGRRERRGRPEGLARAGSSTGSLRPAVRHCELITSCRVPAGRREECSIRSCERNVKCVDAVACKWHVSKVGS